MNPALPGCRLVYARFSGTLSNIRIVRHLLFGAGLLSWELGHLLPAAQVGADSHEGSIFLLQVFTIGARSITAPPLIHLAGGSPDSPANAHPQLGTELRFAPPGKSSHCLVWGPRIGSSVPLTQISALETPA